MNPTFTVKSFSELSNMELYELLRLRSEVFVVEQNCVFLDQDNKDQKCHHLMLWEGGEMVGYTRLVPAGLSYQEMAIGRVVTSPAARGKGYGKVLMEKSIEQCQAIFGDGPIRI